MSTNKRDMQKKGLWIKMRSIIKIIIAISGALGLPAILFTFGSISYSSGALLSNELLRKSGLNLLILGTLVLGLLLYRKRKRKSCW